MERTMIQPLPPQFRPVQRRDRLLGLFADKETVALIANPDFGCWVSRFGYALDVFALRLSEPGPEECEPPEFAPVAATLELFVGAGWSPGVIVGLEDRRCFTSQFRKQGQTAAGSAAENRTLRLVVFSVAGATV